MVMWFALLLLLPTVLGAPAGSELNTFLHVHPGTPVTVSCEGNYVAYVYSSGDSVSAMILVQGNTPIFDPKRYDPVARALLYKLSIGKKYGDVRIMRSDVASALQSLATTLANEEYSYGLAKKSLKQCVPDKVGDVDTLDALRKKALSDLSQTAPRLGKEAEAVSRYLDHSNYVNCTFSVDTSIYDQIKNVWTDLVKLDSYSKKVMAEIQMADTNCDAQTIRGILDLIKPPYDLGQLQFLNTASDAERQLFTNNVSQSDVDSLRAASITMYWKTLYTWLLSAPIHTEQGDVTLSAAFALLENPSIRWKMAALIPRAKQEYSNALEMASKGYYGNAYIELQKAVSDVKAVLDAGVVSQEQSGPSVNYTYVAAGILLVAVLLLLLKKGGKKNEEDDIDYYSDSYA